MKQSFVFLLSLIVIMIACDSDSSEKTIVENSSLDEKSNFWIFICFGQSNMEGQAPIEAQDMTTTDRFLCLGTANEDYGRELGKWRNAQPPLCRAENRLGPIDYFGRTLLNFVPDNVRIGIVMVAISACPITFFDKDKNTAVIANEQRDYMNHILDQYGRDPYGRLVSMSKIATMDGVIKGVILHQGETDAYTDEWRKEVRKIYRDLQKELQFDSITVPLIVGEVVRSEYGGISGRANSVINDIVNHYSNTYVVSSEGCLPDENDKNHFNSEGYRMLGRRYALKYLEATDTKLAEICKQSLFD